MDLVPEEILHDILYLRLHIPVDVFCEFPETTYPQYLPNQSVKTLGAPASSVLLVSQKWLRVATPILYESVRIANASHTRLLASQLKARPYIGPYIKNIRLEGGYNLQFIEYLAYTPNLHTLYLSWRGVSGPDTVQGLMEALPVFNPTKFYLHAPQWSNQTMREVLVTLGTSLARWPSLVSIVSFPDLAKKSW